MLSCCRSQALAHISPCADAHLAKLSFDDRRADDCVGDDGMAANTTTNAITTTTNPSILSQSPTTHTHTHNTHTHTHTRARAHTMSHGSHDVDVVANEKTVAQGAKGHEDADSDDDGDNHEGGWHAIHKPP